jgi:hypothetical protein
LVGLIKDNKDDVIHAGSKDSFIGNCSAYYKLGSMNDEYHSLTNSSNFEKHERKINPKKIKERWSLSTICQTYLCRDTVLISETRGCL